MPSKTFLYKKKFTDNNTTVTLHSTAFSWRTNISQIVVDRWEKIKHFA